MLSQYASGYEHYQALQTYKGWFFVAVTAFLLFLALRSFSSRILTAHERSAQSEQRLELALTSAGGGIWDRGLEGNRTTYIAPQIKELVGLPPDRQITLAEWSQRISREDNENIISSIRAVAKSGGHAIHDARFRVRTEDGNSIWLHSRGSVIHDEKGKPVRMIGVALDITAQMEAEARIRHLTRFDPQTGLANRTTFISQLEELLAQPVASGKMVAVVKIRLGDFDELVNELGLDGSNELLLAIARRLKAITNVNGLVGRLAPDTFAVATPPLYSSARIQNLVKRVAGLFDKPVNVSDEQLTISFSGGAVLWPQDGNSAEKLVANCALALKKWQPGDAELVKWFTEGMDREFGKRSQRVRDLRHAVRNRQIECHFQPVIDLSRGAATGLEALARWRHPKAGLVPPDQFISLAEENGYICEIGNEILRQACNAAARWRDLDGNVPFIAVNVSPIQLENQSFLREVENALSHSGLPADRLEIEVTESVLVNDIETARKRIQALRNLGISVAIDDFGTGYSSLSTLGRIPFTRLKVDRSFITEYGATDEITLIVNAVLSLAGGLGLDITAEGVVTPRQAALLRDRGVNAAQGYYFSPPVGMDQVAGLLKKRWALELAHGEPERLAASS